MGKQKSPAKRKVEEDRVLAIYYEGAMFATSNVNLDRYQMIDLHQDAYVEGRKCGVDVPEYFEFVFCPPGSPKKLPLQSDEDWRNLVSLWEYDGGKIPIYMLALNNPSMYIFIVQQLEASLAGPTKQPVEPPQPEAAQPEPQLPNLTVDLSTYLFFQTTSTSQPEGLVKALANIFPECKRRICDVHYYRNLSTEYPAKTTEGTLFQPTTATPSSSELHRTLSSSSPPVTAQPSSRAPPSLTRQTRSQTISANATRQTRSQTKQA
ncbi:hypothetical protein Cgig2_003748 [Carnegiea gigantea]|uniref:Uncharacterized protein n=1 Tax=Carnegiea gigantea TaxID=171969 RepID=A0A9Q1QF46_9CARY|nr:hypothetical protein Cgig2_003748 [Carnegiea gigantea]